MIYECIKCTYSTKIKCNYKKHILTKRHMDKSTDNEQKECIFDCMFDLVQDGSGGNVDTHTKSINNGSEENKILSQTDKNDILESELIRAVGAEKYIFCKYCKKSFSKLYNLKRHEQYRCKNIKIESDKKITELELKLEIAEKYKLMMINKENEYLKDMLSKANGMVEKSMNALSFAAINYKNAPILKPLLDYSIIDKEDKKNDIEDVVLFHYDKDSLDKFLGDFIIKYYKKSNPHEQSIWSSDCSRLTYVIRKLIDNQPNWITDKKGVNLKLSIIDPLMKYVKDSLKEYITDLGEEIRNGVASNIRLGKILKKMEQANYIIFDIDKEKLSDNVIKYIAPHFFMDKKKEMLLLTHETNEAEK
jgi:hypothetical protein